jgi:hypothetical protein
MPATTAPDTVTFLPEIAGVVEFVGAPGPLNKGETPIRKNVTTTALPYSPWGDDNLFPQQVLQDVRKSTQLSSGLMWKANALVSGGLVYGTTSIDDKTGEERLIPIVDPVIERWNKQTAVNRYCREAALDFYTFWNQWARCSVSRDRSLITRIECMNSPFVRVGTQDSNGKIKKAYVNANWDLGERIFSEDAALNYPLLDPYNDPEYQLKNKPVSEFLYPVVGPDYDYTFYATAPWNSVRESGWLPVSFEIPVFKKNLLQRQFTIKYHFRVTIEFFRWKYPNYDSMTESEKTTAKKDLLKELNDHYAGAARAGQNMLTIDFTDHTGKLIPGVTLEAVDNKIKDGMYIEDSQEASSHIYAALEIDGTLVSTVPGKGMGAGSGSDKRVAFNIYIANRKPDADLILEPIQFAYDYNGFSKKYESKGGLKVWFRNYWITTLDKGKETQQQTA